MNWHHRSAQKELLDEDTLPEAALFQNLRELNVINTWLGGHRITRAGLRALLPARPDRPLHVAETGCGGGDNLRALHQLLRHRGIPHRLTGIDLKPECIRYARTHAGIPPEAVQWRCQSYETVIFPESEKPDILFSSLFCHHFSDEALVAQLRWLACNSRRGFFINDLHRHPLAYHSIRLLTAAFSKSPLVRHDAPLSVQRSFRRGDWEALFRKAHLPEPRISWQWAFRYLVVWQHAPLQHGRLRSCLS